MLKWLGTLLKRPDGEMESSTLSPEELEWNGLMLSGIILPEPVLEIILSKVHGENIVALKRVCQLWNQITKRIAFWKLYFEHNKIPWNIIPEYVKENENGWLVMYMHAKNNILLANFIQNHSGAYGFDHWQIVKDGGGKIRVEEPPLGCDPLPEDEIMFPDTHSCFSTSFAWSIKRQRIDLWKYGLTTETMLSLIPFRIEVTEKYTARFDCGGVYYLAVRMEDRRQSHMFAKRIPVRIPQTMEWKTAKLNFDFREKDKNVIKKLRYVLFRHGGCDNQFWAGHYGTKMAHACVRIIPLGDDATVQYSSDGDEDMNISDDESGPTRLAIGWR